MSAALAPAPPTTVEEIRAVLDSWQRRITLKNVGRGHHYCVDGAKKGCASVTTVNNARVSQRLVDWAARVEREACIRTAWNLSQQDAIAMPKDEATFAERFEALAGVEKENAKQLKEAGAFGTEVHSLIEWYLRSKVGQDVAEPQVSDRALSVFGNFEEWAERVAFETIALEQRLFHIRLNYAGTLDALAYATLPGRPRALYVFDWKTSKGIYPEMRLQSGAYRAALLEMGLPEAGGLLVHLPKEGPDVGTVQIVEVNEPLDELMAAFLAMKQIHTFMGRYR